MWRSITRRSSIAIMAFISPLICMSFAQEPAKGDNVATAAQRRSDSFATKMRLLETAWENQDFDLARSLTHSLRESRHSEPIEISLSFPADQVTSLVREIRVATGGRQKLGME